MSNNVEIECSSLPPLFDDPDTDPHTQRPRVHKNASCGLYIIPRDHCHSVSLTPVKPTRELESNHRRASCTCKVPRGVLRHTEGPDLFCVGPRYSRHSEPGHNYSPYGAAIPWSFTCSGTPEQCCATSYLAGPLLQPCLALLGEPKKCNPLSRINLPQYWEGSILPSNHHGFPIFPNPSKTMAEYAAEAERCANLVKQTKRSTEYQDRFIARIPVPHRKWD
ncbi:hypothetical protein Aperf_G00000091472 [Anoplocephala perfoliata]